MPDDNVTTLQTEAQRAALLKERARSHLEALCLIMDEARSQGFILSFQIGTTQFGKSLVSDVSVIKPL